ISLTACAFFYIIIPHPPTSTFFPYTTLFRSEVLSGSSLDQGFAQSMMHGDHLPAHVIFRDLTRAVGRIARLGPGCNLVRDQALRSEEHTSELQSHLNLVCRLLLEKKKRKQYE